MSTAKTTSLTFSLSAELADKLESFAVQKKVSASQILEEALQLWMREERKDQQTFAALADVDEERHIAQEDMEAWAESLDSDNPLPLPVPRR